MPGFVIARQWPVSRRRNGGREWKSYSGLHSEDLRPAFITYFASFRIDTVEKLALALNDIEAQLYGRTSGINLSDDPQSPYRKTKLREINADPEKAFRDLYSFAFELGRVG